MIKGLGHTIMNFCKEKQFVFVLDVNLLRPSRNGLRRNGLRKPKSDFSVSLKTTCL